MPRGAAQRSTTASTIRLKLAEADRAEGEADAAEKKRADLEKKLAGLEGRIVKAQIDVDKKRATDQKKALDAIRRETPCCLPVHSDDAFRFRSGGAFLGCRHDRRNGRGEPGT